MESLGSDPRASLGMVPVNWLAINQIDWMVSPVKANSEGIVPMRLLSTKTISRKDPVIDPIHKYRHCTTIIRRVISVRFQKILLGRRTSESFFSPDGTSLLVIDRDEVVDEGWG
jgi:hypothetical protein